MNIKSKGIIPVLFFVAVVTGYHLSAQTVVAGTQPAGRPAVIRAVFKKIQKEHYAPRPVDDRYSAAVWDMFIRTLDPNAGLFLQKDIKALEAYRYKVDDELNAGSTGFFDAAYTLYNQRVQEVAAVCKKIIAQPFDLQKQESVLVMRDKQPFPADERAREDIWRKLIKYRVLQKYMEMDTAKKSGPVNVQLVEKARAKVSKRFNTFFNQEAGPNVSSDKFAQYMAVAVSQIDPHSAYTAPEDHSFDEQLSKRYYGLGIELGNNEADYYVKRMVAGGPAYRSGQVKENDHIIAIADNKGMMQTVSDMDATQVSALIRGEKGSVVKMELQQPGEGPRTVTVPRGEVTDNENKAKSAVIEKNGKKIGYVWLPLFYVDPSGYGIYGCAADMAREVAKLQENEVDAIMVDLRGNGGGSLQEFVQMSSVFLPAGPVTFLKGKDTVTRYDAPALHAQYDGPMAVLVDENSASASEMFSAAMQDSRRAIIIGTASTFGKGTAQESKPLGRMGDRSKAIPDTSYGTVRVTMNKFYRINGSATQLRGVTPDIVLQQRMAVESVMEKDMPAILPYDTLQLTPFEKLPLQFNYKIVVEKAYERIHRNPAFADVEKNMQQMTMVRKQPTPLGFSAYRDSWLQSKACERNIQEDRALKGVNVLDVKPNISRNVNPALMKADAAGRAHYNEWLQKISKDIYISETVSVLEDMLANPL